MVSFFVRACLVGGLSAGLFLLPVRAQETTDQSDSLVNEPEEEVEAGEPVEKNTQVRFAAGGFNTANIAAREIRTIEVWIRSFIPNVMWNRTNSSISFGQYAGRTGIGLPGTNNVLGQYLSNLLFLDDGRRFSRDRSNRFGEGPSSRVQSYARLSLTDGGLRLSRRWGFVGGTIAVDNSTGQVVCSTADNAFASEVQSTYFIPEAGSGGSNSVRLKVDASASNHCALAVLPVSLQLNLFQGLVPAIDYEGTLSVSATNGSCSQGQAVTRTTGLVEFKGRVDGFPAYEMLVSVNGRRPVLVQGEPVRTDDTMLKLAGDADDKDLAGRVRISGTPSCPLP